MDSIPESPISPKKTATTDQKIDKILELLQNSSTQQSIENPLVKYEQKIKTDIKKYMLKNFNVQWINDKIEENIYDVFFDELFTILNKFVA